MLRFSLFGFPVAVHWMFWVNTALLGGGLNASTPREMQGLLLWVAAAFLSVLIHELGHTFMQRRFGARAQIMLYAFGGLAIPDRNFAGSQRLVISLAGPVTQFIAGFLMKQLIQHSTGDVWFVQEFLESFWEISILWSLFNLLPVFPLDGGHVLDTLLGPTQHRLTLIIGIVCAAAVALFVFVASSSPALAAIVPSPFNRYLHPLNALIIGFLGYTNVQRLRGDRSTF